MSEVDLRERIPAPPQHEATRPSPALARLSELARRHAWPTAKELARPLGLYVASRIVIFVAIGLVIDFNLGAAAHNFAGPWPSNPPGNKLFEALGMWDGGWYMRIAHAGYTTLAHPYSPGTPTVAFLPLLPVLLRITVFLTGLNVLYAGVLLSAVTGAAASIAVWYFVRWITDSPTADRSTALWCFFPGAMMLSFVYTEGLLVILGVICLVALMRGRWLIAGLAAAAASALTPAGLALIACCAWGAGAAILRRPRTRGRWFALVAPLLAPAGWLTYQGYLWRRTGDPTFYFQIEKKFWQAEFNPYASTIGRVVSAVQHPGVFDYLVPAIGVFVLIAAAILLWRWKPPALVTIYAATTMALVIASGATGPRPRFFLVAFPFIVALVLYIRGPAFNAMLGVSALSLGLLTFIMVANVSVSLHFTP